MRSIAIALLIFLPAATASADNPGRAYVFLGGAAIKSAAPGADRATNDAALAAAGFTVISSTENTSGATFSIGAGYWLSQHFALQAAYTDLGAIHRYSGTFTSGPTSGNQVKEWEGSALELGLLGALRIFDGIYLEAKVGAARLEGKHRTATLIGSSASGTEASGSATIAILGVGVAYDVTTQIRVRALLEHWGDADAFGAGNELAKIRLFSISAAYRF